MTTKVERWLYGLGSAVVGGGASAIVSGFTAMGFAPDKFNFTTPSGVGHFFEMAAINFAVSAFLSGMFYLKQSPLPPEGGDTTTITRASVTQTQITTVPNNPPTNP